MNLSEAVSESSGNSLFTLCLITNLRPMKIKKPDWKEIVIFIETAILAKLLFHYWDGVKAYISALFS